MNDMRDAAKANAVKSAKAKLTKAVLNKNIASRKYTRLYDALDGTNPADDIRAELLWIEYMDANIALTLAHRAVAQAEGAR